MTSTTSPPVSSARSSVDWCAFGILLLALLFRLYRLDVPFVDAHSWRQVTNADIARLWAEGPIDFFYPAVSWGGPDGRVGLEFPLLHLFIALAWRLAGTSNEAGRLVPVAFSLVTVWWTYRLGTRLFSPAAGRAAAFLMAVSPSVVYFGRTPLSDTPMLAFSVAAVLGYVAYTQTGRARHALFGAVALALAGLFKLPAVLVLGPVLWTGLVTKGLRRTLADPWFVAAPLAAIGAIALWYLHADQIYLETGLTQAIFRPSGTYAADIAQYAGPFTTVSHWTRRDLLTWDTANELLFRYWALHLTPIFTVLTLAGLASWRWTFRARSIVDVWTLAAASLVAVSLAGQIPHEFHQLPTLPPLALYFGMAAAPLFSDAFHQRMAGRLRLVSAAVAAAVLVAAAVFGFVKSGVIPHLYRPDNLNQAVIDAGWAIEKVTPAGALIATVEYERYGTNSPMVLYFAHRRGWSFDATSISSAVVDYLHDRRGVCFVAVADWPALQVVRPEMASDLARRRVVDLPYTHDRFRLFDLGCPAAATP
ncbi:MAG: glycosyltransferase family 39 protein [Acidobacteria bacterium]|nr:glycosyltransferase family 39 protein [Acidobacteriota bacterium]